VRQKSDYSSIRKKERSCFVIDNSGFSYFRMLQQLQVTSYFRFTATEGSKPTPQMKKKKNF